MMESEGILHTGNSYSASSAWIPDDEDSQAWEKVSGYWVCLIPEGITDDWYNWMVTVEYRGEKRWAVMWTGLCLTKGGAWEYEPPPSSRSDKWLVEHRFTKKEARRRAREVAPMVSVNGVTAAVRMARYGHEKSAGVRRSRL